MSTISSKFPVAGIESRPSSQGRTAAVPAALVLAALFIDLAFGRWGAYIRTPIPGLFLPDALLAVGAIWALTRLRQLRQLPTRILWAFGLVLIYVLVRLIIFALTNSPGDPYLVIRDLAPFAYLALVPLLAISLARARFAWLLWTVRIATLLNLSVALLLTLGSVSPFSSDLLGGDAVYALGFRPDLQGVIWGLGVIAWGAWPGMAKSSRIAQFAFLFAAVSVGSRSALAAFLVCLGVAVWRDFHRCGNWKSIAAWMCALVAATAGQILVTELHQFEGGSTSAVASAFPGAAKFTGYLGAGDGTASARIETWKLVLGGLRRDHLWAVGSGPGTDILYWMCTGIPKAPTRTIVTDDQQMTTFLPKCPVDDSNAATTLRDPHQWLLALLIYNGAVGTLIFLAALLLPIWKYRRSANASLPLAAILAYFVCGSFGVLISSPFGMLPVAVMLAWLISSAGVFTTSEAARSLSD